MLSSGLKIIVTALSAFTLSATIALAGAPRTINYQGYLKNADNTPVNVQKNIVFSLYSSNPHRSNPVWQEPRSITPANGIYSVLLGSSTPITAAFDAPYWLGIKIGNDQEMALQPLSSTPYALRAATADSVATGGVTSQTLADGSVTLSKLNITSTSLVPSLNSDLLDSLHASDIISAAADQCSMAVNTLQNQLTSLQNLNSSLLAQNNTLQTLLASLATSSLFQSRWGSAQLLENYTGSADYPQIATDRAGNAIAVWRQMDSSISNIYANRYVNGIGWGTPQMIKSPTGYAQSPQVTIDRNGNAFAIWQQEDASFYSIYTNRYVIGYGWETPQIIETGAGDSQEPQIAADGFGNAIAVWRQHDGTYSSIYANRYVNGVGWGTALLIEHNTGDAYSPQIAFDSTGNAIAVWFQNDGTYSSIYANRYVNGVGWGVPQLIENNAYFAYNPRVSIDSTGDAVAVWYQGDGTNMSIYSNRHVKGIGWGTAQLIENLSGDAISPQIATDSTGNAISVWYQNDGTRTGIYASRYVKAIGWDSPQLLDSNIGSAHSPQIAMDNLGNALTIWPQIDGPYYNIYANRFINGIGWGTPYLLESNTGNAYMPQIATDSGGNAFGIWYQYDGIAFSIYANRFTK